MRIGYFSSDCHDHATMFLMAGLFEEHDRTRFEVTVFSFGLASQDAMRQRLLAGVERFIDVREKSDQEVVALARSLELDIAVDLKGFTSGARTELFALRVAPIQVSYLGYPGTMGVPYMEYLIADHTLIPAPSRVHYSEKVVYLPDSYQVNDSRRAIAARVFTREQVGLPAQGFVFCCFNNSYKILPAVFDVWMRLLQRVPGSVLWLLQDNAGAMQNLYQEAQRRGVDPSRLVFATRLGHSEHLSRQRLADLFLDTLPYNAHTTASDALWSGLPVLTCMGESFAARVGASLLKAVGLPELISENLAQYEALAVQLASQPQRLAALRERLAANRATAALFDTRRFTRNLERAYAQILQRHRDGLPPDHIEVGSEP
jgi:predicted O-linked N-acetylglucosamine transferase (SPINDLY family)